MTQTKVLGTAQLYPDIDKLTQDAFHWCGPQRQYRNDLSALLKRRLHSALKRCHREYDKNWRRYVRGGKELVVLDYGMFIPRERALDKLDMRIRRLLNIK